jgi:hypothetical protein
LQKGTSGQTGHLARRSLLNTSDQSPEDPISV